MTALATLPAGARPSPYATVSYRAFRIGQLQDVDRCAHEIDIGEPETLQQAKDAAAVRCSHKDHVAIRETGTRLRRWANGAEEVRFDRLHLYAIKRKSAPRYEGTFGERRVHDLYAELVCVLPGEVLA